MLRIKSIWRVVVPGVAGVALLAACGGQGQGVRSPSNEGLARAGAVSGSYRLPADASASHVIAIAQARHEYAATLSFERTLAEALPNQQITVNGAAQKPVRAVVIGTITDVAPGAAFSVAGDDADSGTPTRFDDPKAAWRIAVVTVKAEHYLAGDPAGVTDQQRTVKFGAFISADDDAVAQMVGLKNLGKVIVLLDPDRTYPFEPGLPWIARSGSLLGDVDSAGTIGFPALGTGSKKYVGSLTTVGRVVAAAAAQPGPLVVSVDAATGKVSWSRGSAP